VEAPASPPEKAALAKLDPERVNLTELAGEKVDRILTRAPGNSAPLGGLKVVTANGWFAARPSGTEDIYKIYAESFRGETHMHKILKEAQTFVSATLATSAPSKARRAT
jgi:phosphoglucomutase